MLHSKFLPHQAERIPLKFKDVNVSPGFSVRRADWYKGWTKGQKDTQYFTTLDSHQSRISKKVDLNPPVGSEILAP